MGVHVSKIRQTISLTVVGEERKRVEERVQILEKMVCSHLESARNVMLREKDKHGIHTVITVEVTEQVNILTL